MRIYNELIKVYILPTLKLIFVQAVLNTVAYQSFLGTTVIAVAIPLILSMLCNRVTVNALVFVLRIVFFM